MSEQSRIAYFYHGDVGNYYYGPGHPMKPQRIRLAHHLILTYKLYRHLEVYKPHRSTFQELMDFHSEDYVDFLSKINPDIMDEYKSSFEKFGIGNNSDCPIYDGIYDFCQLYSGASLDAAVRLNHGLNDICVNWSGGLHHAKKAQASGFCYVNDIVLAILELLKYYPRVLYIDIDVHHGDGVEEAFYLTDRVMTCSFHKFGDYFPGSGALKDVGIGPGKYYAVNIPLDSGIDDESYKFVFEPVITKIMEVFQPSAIVLQCGADSVTGDRLGCFNLSLRGHASCVKFVQRFHVPTLVLGGGGYTIRNVARTWAFETSVLLDKEVPNDIPYNDFIEWYAPTYQLHLIPTDMENKNNKEKLKTIIETVTEHLRHIEGAPSCQLQNRPPDWSLQSITNKKELEDEDGDDREHPDHLDTHVQHKSEYYDDDHDNDKTSNSNNSRGDLENEKTDSIQVKIKDNGINMKEVNINSDTTKSPLTKNSTA